MLNKSKAIQAPRDLRATGHRRNRLGNTQEAKTVQSEPSDCVRYQRIINSDTDLEKYCAMAVERGATHAGQIYPSSVVTAPWVRLKCQFGRPHYGRGHCCPPRTPDHDQTRVILDSYRRAILFHIETSRSLEDEWVLLKCRDALVDLEGVMFKDGYYKAFLFLAGPCRLCEKCAASEQKPCTFPWKARPCMEGCGIDVFQTARNNGFSIETLPQKTDTSHVYCLMMVD
jgi:predicted metal-binding protein